MIESTQAHPPVRVAVVVVAFNCPDLLDTCISRCEFDVVPAKVVVVDNSDRVEMREATQVVCGAHGWDYVASPGNVGFGAAVNVGARRAFRLGARTVLILNPDAWLGVATTRALDTECANHPLRAVSPAIFKPNGEAWFRGGAMNPSKGRLRSKARELHPGEVAWLTGACLAMSAALWDLVGGFDDRYFLYWEDVDLSWRIAQAGGELRVIDELLAYHTVGATQGGATKSPDYVYYNTRNRLLFAALHLDGRQRRGWLMATPRAMWEMVTRGGRTPAAWRAGIRGSVSGIALALRPATVQRRGVPGR